MTLDRIEPHTELPGALLHFDVMPADRSTK
jgi:hypothetical protein